MSSKPPGPPFPASLARRQQLQIPQSDLNQIWRDMADLRLKVTFAKGDPLLYSKVCCELGRIETCIQAARRNPLEWPAVATDTKRRIGILRDEVAVRTPSVTKSTGDEAATKSLSRGKPVL